MQQLNSKSIRREFINPSTRMLPLVGLQRQVYRYAEKRPPGLEGYQPRWEVVNAVLGAQQTVQVKVDIMTDFHLLAILASSGTEVAPGIFRAQFYDVLKQLRFADRGLQSPLLGGSSRGAFFLREPYRFDLPRSQMLVMLQNMATVANTVQIVFYGLAAPFTGSLSNE